MKPFTKTNAGFTELWFVRYSERMVHPGRILGVNRRVGAQLEDTRLGRVPVRVRTVGERGGTPRKAVEPCRFLRQRGGRLAVRGWLEGTEIIPVRERPHAAPRRHRHVRSLSNLADVVLPTLKIKGHRIRVSFTETHRRH